MESSSMDIGQLVWPTYWLFASIFVGAIVHVIVRFLQGEQVLRKLQHAPVRVGAGVFVAALFWAFSGSLLTALAALLWGTILPPAARSTCAFMGSCVSWIWDTLGGGRDGD